MAGNGYRSGDFWRIDDRTGFRVRSSETVKQWDSLIVSRGEYEDRHPQDFVRGRRDQQSVPDPRPEPEGRTVGPSTGPFILLSDGQMLIVNGQIQISYSQVETTVTADDL